MCLRVPPKLTSGSQLALTQELRLRPWPAGGAEAGKISRQKMGGAAKTGCLKVLGKEHDMFALGLEEKVKGCLLGCPPPLTHQVVRGPVLHEWQEGRACVAEACYLHGLLLACLAMFASVCVCSASSAASSFSFCFFNFFAPFFFGLVAAFYLIHRLSAPWARLDLTSRHAPLCGAPMAQCQ